MSKLSTEAERAAASSRDGRTVGRGGAWTWAGPLLTVGALLVLWQVWVVAAGVDPLVLPSPLQIGEAAWFDRAILGPALGRTAGVVAAGALIAAALGVATGAAMHLSPALSRALDPLLVGTQAIPIPILAPLLVVWLGFGLAPQLVLVVLVAFFPVAVATRAALAEQPPATALVLRNLGAGRLRRLQLAELRGAAPGIITGLRLAVVFAVIGAVFGDAAGTGATTAADPTSTGGLGRVVDDAITQLQTARALAAVALLAALALMLFWMLGRLAAAFAPPSPHHR